MNKRTTFTPAGRLERIFAFLIDKILLIFPAMLLLALTGHTDAKQVGPIIAIDFLCHLVYFSWALGSSWQASPGQRLLGIYVVHADGRPLTRRDAVERFLAFVLPQLPAYTTLLDAQMGQTLSVFLVTAWLIPILIRDDRTGLHDQLCNTRVVAGKARGS